ncbi:MAG: hypothetical protein MUF73_10465 [Rhodobacteraceae bacterium]|jgi:hypothetical protein|nr:hypothetical protein [Paracoccaceae bacterium]
MTDKATPPGKTASGKSRAVAARADRLKAALKANIARRKARSAVSGTASGAGSQQPDDTARR